jgi:hypothetical protein
MNRMKSRSTLALGLALGLGQTAQLSRRSSSGQDRDQMKSMKMVDMTA